MARGNTRKVSLAERREMRAQLTDPGPVMEAAAAFLGVRPRSVAETSRRLRHLGYPDALVETVVVRLVEMEYLDDGSFARAWVESRDRARPRGENALRRELMLKGVPRTTIDEVLTERADSGHAGEPDRAAALALLDRRRAALGREQDPRRRRQKAYALLARNGFAPEVCASAAAAFAEPRPDEESPETADG